MPGTIGPLGWAEWPWAVHSGEAVSTTTNFYSDHDMQCPGGWYGGFKEGRVTRWGTAERSLSTLFSGDWQGSQFSFSVSDYDRSVREALAGGSVFWNDPLTIRMTNRETRALLGIPYTVFVGNIIEAHPTVLGWDLTLSDTVGSTVLSDQQIMPFRRIGDSGLLETMISVSEDLDRDSGEPIVYGENIRVFGVDPPSPQGFCTSPIYLGTMEAAVDAWHVWLVAGHACAAVDIRVDDAITEEGSDWLIPHHTTWFSVFGANYYDFTNPTTGVTRRYTLILGRVGSAAPEACATGESVLTVAVSGVESDGDGEGAVITDRFQQYKHFLINYVANRGASSYMSGTWLDNPTWDLFDGPVTIVEEETFDDASAVAALRLPATDGSPTPAGYIGAAVIDERSSVRRWIADWNRSCGCLFGVTHLGQMRVVLISPTEAIKAAAPLYEEVNDFLRDSFKPDVLWESIANSIPYRADFNHAKGKWATEGTFTWDESVAQRGRTITGEAREYPFAPGVTQADHLARLEALLRKDPPRVFQVEVPVEPEGANAHSMGYLDLGDYFRYRHFAGVNNDSGEIRLAQVIKHQVLVGERRVLVEAMDVEDYIGYDIPAEGLVEVTA